MDKHYQPQKTEKKISALWEKGSYFTPKVNPKKEPFAIILPLPNANDPMHIGHALFTIQDIMCRYHRMLGQPTLWLPGSDHAGIETQFVFEKKLEKEGKSRFDFDRKTLYQKIWNFVEENRQLNINQMKKLGFSLDWSRYHYSLEPKIVNNVLAVFKKLYQDGLIYRDSKIVNYCTHCGTAFSDLEIDYQERDDQLYFLDYGPITIATTRPETIFADVAVAVNPKDSRYTKLIGQKALVPIINKKVPIIVDDLVKTDFGTGALKITPGHDLTDYQIGQKHQLPSLSCINSSGKMINVPQDLAGLYPKQARKKVIEILTKTGKLVKTEPLHHTVGFCYRCQNVIEPLLMPQWFVKIEPLAKPAIRAVKNNQIKFFPNRFKKQFLNWLTNIHDWNISRQIVWGPQIPAWYCLDCNPNIKINFLNKDGQLIADTYSQIKNKYPFAEIKAGLQSLTAPVGAKFIIDKGSHCPDCGQEHLLQETDTFDTWFLSGQWPLNTLGFNPNNPQKSHPDFQYFYPTSVLDTMWDILFFWVARMIMFGLYLTNEVPFKLVHLHARVVDDKGKKMSKSRGNVVDPLVMTEKYGTDALRMSLVYGIAPASDFVVAEKKIESMRNFTNKIWNATRFILINLENSKNEIQSASWRTKKLQISSYKTKNKDDQKILKSLEKTINSVTAHIENYRFGQAAEDIYAFFWHEFCDIYIEQAKKRLYDKDNPQDQQEALSVLLFVLKNSLKLLHPFMPFVTEEIWTNQLGEKTPLAVSPWPEIK